MAWASDISAPCHCVPSPGPECMVGPYGPLFGPTWAVADLSAAVPLQSPAAWRLGTQEGWLVVLASHRPVAHPPPWRGSLWSLLSLLLLLPLQPLLLLLPLQSLLPQTGTGASSRACGA